MLFEHPQKMRSTAECGKSCRVKPPHQSTLGFPLASAKPSSKSCAILCRCCPPTSNPPPRDRMKTMSDGRQSNGESNSRKAFERNIAFNEPGHFARFGISSMFCPERHCQYARIRHMGILGPVRIFQVNIEHNVKRPHEALIINSIRGC